MVKGLGLHLMARPTVSYAHELLPLDVLNRKIKQYTDAESLGLRIRKINEFLQEVNEEQRNFLHRSEPSTEEEVAILTDRLTAAMGIYSFIQPIFDLDSQCRILELEEEPSICTLQEGLVAILQSDDYAIANPLNVFYEYANRDGIGEPYSFEKPHDWEPRFAEVTSELLEDVKSRKNKVVQRNSNGSKYSPGKLAIDHGKKFESFVKQEIRGVFSRLKNGYTMDDHFLYTALYNVGCNVFDVKTGFKQDYDALDNQLRAEEGTFLLEVPELR